MKPTDAAHYSTDLKIEQGRKTAAIMQYSFFWDEQPPNNFCTTEVKMQLQPTVTLPRTTTQTISLEHEDKALDSHNSREESSHKSNNLENMLEMQIEEEDPTQSDITPSTSECSTDLIPAQESQNVYNPTVISEADLPYHTFYDAMIQRRNQERQIRKAEQFLRNSVLLATHDQVYNESVTTVRQSTEYCDIDANDDATLWMLLQLSAKKLRGQTWPYRNRDDLRELLLIQHVAEKAFKHLFPPIKL
ncbi:unnamed protein product [Cylicocyclus nassatus]|uniref:Uncharacterized protein n=1 Tax=Cylicocyclus nassatus TaxID=53992 RepID=A0AA36GWU4_CYLNA|nr:unnamed protein product [Cylicocyclus nassatus]